MTPEQIAREFVEDDSRLCDLEEQMSVCLALLALQRENAALREALHEARIYVDLTHDMTTDRFVRMRSGTCLDRIDVALAPSAAPGEGEP